MTWRHLQSDNIEFTIKRLREPIDADNRRDGHTNNSENCLPRRRNR
jgi:hypothetical protein